MDLCCRQWACNCSNAAVIFIFVAKSAAVDRLSANVTGPTYSLGHSQSPLSQTLACSCTAIRSHSLRWLMVSTPVIHANYMDHYWSANPGGMEGWVGPVRCPIVDILQLSCHLSTVDRVQDGESPPSKDWRRNHWAAPPTNVASGRWMLTLVTRSALLFFCVFGLWRVVSSEIDGWCGQSLLFLSLKCTVVQLVFISVAK